MCVVMPKYIQKRRRRWYAVLEIPKDLRGTLGKDRFVESLGTESQTEAERLVLSVVARWKAEIEEARTGNSIPDMELAQAWRSDWVNYPDSENRSIQRDGLDEKTHKMRRKNPEAADNFERIVTGTTFALRDSVDEWLLLSKNTAKTIDMQRSDVNLFLGIFQYSHQVTKRAVREWAHNFQQTEGIAATTARRRISASRSYWDFLQRAGYITQDDDPFAGAIERTNRKSQASYSGKRSQFTADEVVTLLTAAEAKKDLQLRDLIWLGMWTGCRIEEICSLKITNVMDTHFRIVEAKTEAGNREVPIHSKLAASLKNHCSVSRDGYVLEGLSFNKYSDRCNAIGKRFGRLKTSLGFGRNLVFHSIRKTVATQLENAKVGENIAADILGHEKQTITFGLYSGGASAVLMQQAIEELNYPV